MVPRGSRVPTHGRYPLPIPSEIQELDFQDQPGDRATRPTPSSPPSTIQAGAMVKWLGMYLNPRVKTLLQRSYPRYEGESIEGLSAAYQTPKEGFIKPCAAGCISRVSCRSSCTPHAYGSKAKTPTTPRPKPSNSIVLNGRPCSGYLEPSAPLQSRPSKSRRRFGHSPSS